jgi:hypothetical protein
MQAARVRVRDTLLSARIIAVAALAPALLRLPLTRVEELLEPRRVRPGSRADVHRVAEHVDRILAARPPLVRQGCLTRGLTMYYFLRRAGADVRLVFGIGRPAGALDGHCWIVLDDEPYRERRDPRAVFAETYRIPRADPRSAA